MPTLREMAEVAASRGLTREEFDRRMRRLGILNTSTASPETVIAQGAVDMATAPRTQSTTDTFDPKTLAATESDPLTFDKPAVFSAIRELPKAPEPEPEFQPQPVQPATMPQPSMPEQPQMPPEQAIQLQRQFERGVPFATDVEQQLQAQQAPQLSAAPAPPVVEQPEGELDDDDGTTFGFSPAELADVGLGAMRRAAGLDPVYVPARIKASAIRNARGLAKVARKLPELDFRRYKALYPENWGSNRTIDYTLSMVPANTAGALGVEIDRTPTPLTAQTRRAIDAELDRIDERSRTATERAMIDVQSKSEGKGFWGTLGNAMANVPEEIAEIVSGTAALLNDATGGNIPQEYWFAKPSQDSAETVLAQVLAPGGLFDVTDLAEDGSEQPDLDTQEGLLIRDADDKLALYGDSFVAGLAATLRDPAGAAEAYPFTALTTLLPFARALGVGKLAKVTGESFNKGLDKLEGTEAGKIVAPLRNLNSRLNRYTSDTLAFRDPQAADLAERVLRQPVETEQAMLNISRQAEQAALIDEANLLVDDDGLQTPASQMEYPDPDPEAGATAGYDFGVREVQVDQSGNLRRASPTDDATVKVEPKRVNLPERLVGVVNRFHEVFGDEVGVLGDASVGRQALYDTVQASFDERIANNLQINALRSKVIDNLKKELEPFLPNKAALNKAIDRASAEIEAMVAGQKIGDIVFRVKRQQPKTQDGKPIINDGKEVVVGDAVIRLVEDVMIPTLASDPGFSNKIASGMVGVAFRRQSQKARINSQQRAVAEVIASHIEGIKDASKLSTPQLKELVGARGVTPPSVEIRTILNRYNETGDLPIVSRNEPRQLLDEADSLGLELPRQITERLESRFDGLGSVSDDVLQAIGLQDIDLKARSRTSRPSLSMNVRKYDAINPADGSFTTSPGLYMHKPLARAIEITAKDRGWAQVPDGVLSQFVSRLTPTIKAFAVPLNATSISAAYIGNIITGTLKHGPGWLNQGARVASDYSRFRRGQEPRFVPREFLEGIAASDILDSSFVQTEVLGRPTPPTPEGFMRRSLGRERLDSLKEAGKKAIKGAGEGLSLIFDSADSMAKLTEAWMNYQPLIRDFADLAPGKSIQLEAGPAEMVTIRKTMDGEFELASRTGRSKRGVGKRLTDSQFHAILARAAGQPAARTFVNFNNLPLGKTYIRTVPALDSAAAKPFSGWIAGTQTTPYRLGLLGELLQGSAVRGATNDPAIRAKRFLRDASNAAARNAAIGMLIQKSDPSETEMSRLISYTGDPIPALFRKVGGDEVVATDLSSANPFGETALLARLLTPQADLNELLGVTMINDDGDEIQPAITSISSINESFQNPKDRQKAYRIRKEVLDLYNLRKRAKTGVIRDPAALITIASNLAGLGLGILPAFAQKVVEPKEQDLEQGIENYSLQLLLDYALPGTIQQVLTALEPAKEAIVRSRASDLSQQIVDIDSRLEVEQEGSQEYKDLEAQKAALQKEIGNVYALGATYAQYSRASSDFLDKDSYEARVRPSSEGSTGVVQRAIGDFVSAFLSRERALLLARPEFKLSKTQQKLRNKIKKSIARSAADVSSVQIANMQTGIRKNEAELQRLNESIDALTGRTGSKVEETRAGLAKQIRRLKAQNSALQQSREEAKQLAETVKTDFDKVFDEKWLEIVEQVKTVNDRVNRAVKLRFLIDRAGFTPEQAEQLIEESGEFLNTQDSDEDSD